MNTSTPLSNRCPKCTTGRLFPDHSYDVPAVHCFSCGFLILGERPVLMKGIPPVGKQLSMSPAAVYDRELRARVKANGGPLRLGPQRVRKQTLNCRKKEVNP